MKSYSWWNNKNSTFEKCLEEMYERFSKENNFSNEILKKYLQNILHQLDQLPLGATLKDI